MIIFVVGPIEKETSGGVVKPRWPLWWDQVHTQATIICYKESDSGDYAMCVSETQDQTTLLNIIKSNDDAEIVDLENANRLGNEWFPAIEAEEDGSTPWTGFDLMERIEGLGLRV